MNRTTAHNMYKSINSTVLYAKGRLDLAVSVQITMLSVMNKIINERYIMGQSIQQ
jgi:hypothetical protein